MIPIPEDGYFQPRVKPKHRCPMTDELIFVRKHVIPKLLKHPFSLPFKYPVDAIQEGIYPDYFMVVSHPMDLYTIKSRLDHGWYWNLGHCLTDINLVWRNARLYNPPDHILHQWAVSLKNFTYAQIKRMKNAKPSDKQTDRINNTNLRKCEELLEGIMDDVSLSNAFKIIPPQLSDGHSGLKIPLDLDTIEKKLQSALYEDADAFAYDFRKMISETYRNRTEKDPLVKNAKELSHKFEYEFARCIDTDEDSSIDMKESYSEDQMNELLEKMMKETNEIEKQLKGLIEEENERHAEERRVDAADLVKKISCLSTEGIKKVLDIVQQDEAKLSIKAEDSKSCLKQEEDDYLTLDFDNMSYTTIRHLREYVDTVS